MRSDLGIVIQKVEYPTPVFNPLAYIAGYATALVAQKLKATLKHRLRKRLDVVQRRIESHLNRARRMVYNCSCVHSVQFLNTTIRFLDESLGNSSFSETGHI